MADRGPDSWDECIDFAGRSVSFSRRVVEHTEERHPEITGFLEYVCQVLVDPDFVYERTRVHSLLFYRLGVLTGRASNTCMVVVVRYNEADEGEVRTVYPTTRPASGDRLTHLRTRRGP